MVFLLLYRHPFLQAKRLQLIPPKPCDSCARFSQDRVSLRIMSEGAGRLGRVGEGRIVAAWFSLGFHKQ